MNLICFLFLTVFFSSYININVAICGENFEIPLGPHIEVLDSKLTDKTVDEISLFEGWNSINSPEGKSKISFKGNWYRLVFGNWLPRTNEDLVMVYPLSPNFKLFRKEGGLFRMSDHGYLSTHDDRIYYRRTAIALKNIGLGEIVYFKVWGKPSRSSDNPYLTTVTRFLSSISKEFPLSIFYYSFILIVSIVSIFAFFILGEKIFLFYSLYMLSTVGVFLGIQGYIYQYTTLWRPSITIFFFGVVNFFIITFISELFKFKTKLQKFLVHGSAGISLVFALISIFGQPALAFNGLYTVIIATQLSIVGICIYQAKIQRNERWLLLAISFSFIVSSLGLINDKIWIPFSDLIDDAFQPMSLLEIVLFACVLLRRFQQLNLEKKEAIELVQIKTLEAIKLEAEKEKLRAEAEIGAAAAQTAHDLASPISSLNMLMQYADVLPENVRVLMRHSVNRISDIVQGLKQKGREVRSSSNINDRQEVILLASIISAIVSEKRIELRSKENVELNLDFGITYDLFAKVNPVELKRVISNVINNAVDAFEGKPGIINVEIKSVGEHVVIAIKDNGVGIPQEILTKLGQKGVTYGKAAHLESGSGLGLYHARSTIESFSGKLIIESVRGEGTCINIELNKESPPEWFVKQLELGDMQTVVAIDDDPSVLEIWSQRFVNFIKSKNVNLITLKSINSLKEWIAENPIAKKSAIFLIDFEFITQKNLSGLDAIEQLKLNDRAVLVSSRYEETEVLERCKKMGVRVIPKSMAPYVPIVFSTY